MPSVHLKLDILEKYQTSWFDNQQIASLASDEPYQQRRSHGSNSSSYVEILVDDNEALTKTFLFTQCEKCKNPRPPRCHHCTNCQQCVLRYDHHSNWLATCIGIDNHKGYILHLLYSSICFIVSPVIVLLSKQLHKAWIATMLYLIAAIYFYHLSKAIYLLTINKTLLEYLKNDKNVFAYIAI